MNICVFLASRYGKNPKFQEATREVGEWIAKNGHTLVYGGSDVGLMKVLCDAALENHGHVISVCPDVELIKKVQHKDLDQYIYTGSVSERKEKMMNLSDAFISMPGAVGTLDEASDVIAQLKLNIFDKPCIMYNVDGFYEPLRQMLQNIIEAGFMDAEAIKRVTFAENIQDVEKALS